MVSVQTHRNHYTVAIVGGGIAGVTLALALEKLGIDYALFEAHNSLAPDEGASIGMIPNGLRILDQLGIYEEVEQSTAALKRWHHIDGSGNLISKVDVLGYYPSKIGYGALFLERRRLLEIMSNKLQGNGFIKTSCRVSSLREEEDHVIVQTSDGFSITADLVIGADGVRSCVRGFIDASSTAVNITSDDYMSTRFACVYGISQPTQGISEGDVFSVYREEATVLGFTGKQGVVYWFVVEDLGKELPLSQTPRYVAADANDLCLAVSHLQVAPGVTFGDVYKNRTVAMKIPLEEGLAEVWHTDRMVIVGDAAHKMVPNGAMGANQAIEDSAVLVNELNKVVNAHPGGKLPREPLRAALTRFSERKERTGDAMRRAGMICRAQLCHTGQAATVLQELPTLSDGDWLFRGFLAFSAAPVLEDVPMTDRALYYQRACKMFMQKFMARQEGVLKASNSVLMGINDVRVEQSIAPQAA